MSDQLLRVGGVPEHFNLPWRLAIESGAFAVVGADVTWTDFPGGTGALTEALANDELDLATVLTEGITTAICKGNPSRVHSVWVESPLAWGVHVPAQSDFTSIAELVGHRFAISRFGSGSELMAYVLADNEGWTLTPEQFVVVGGLAGAIDALPAGDAEIFLWERFMTQPHVDDGTFRRVADTPTPWPSFVTAVTSKAAQNHRAVIDRVTEVAASAATELAASPDAASLIAERYGLELSEAETWLGTVSWAPPVRPDAAMLDAVIDTMLRLGRIGTDRPADELLVAKLADQG